MKGFRMGWGGLAVAVALVLGARASEATNGHVLHGFGSVNQAMGGAGIATSIDAIGSNTNNISSISFLERHGLEFGAEIFMPNRRLSSSATLPDGTFLSGSVKSRTREAVIPSFGGAYHLTDRWTVGFSGVGIAGFGVDYPANLPSPDGNFSPVSLPQSQGGFGALYSNLQLLQMTPSVSYKLTPKFSVGLGVNVNWAGLSVAPWPATPPNASGYPTGTHMATTWGSGFTLGATWRLSPMLAFGFTFKSPQWFDDFRWNSQYPDGEPTSFRFRLDYPMIVGGGLAYTPGNRWLFAADVRWINYRDTPGFEAKNFEMTNRGPFVRGFGWDNILAVALGVQYKLRDWLPVRVGYNYSDNPIPSNQQFFNVFAPAIVQHRITAGLGLDVTSHLSLNLAYYHAFRNRESGAFPSNGGPGLPPLNDPIPGTSVTNSLSEDSVSMQMAVRF